LLADRFHVVARDRAGFRIFQASRKLHAQVVFRLSLARPKRVTAITSQNGNATEERLSTRWNPIQGRNSRQRWTGRRLRTDVGAISRRRAACARISGPWAKRPTSRSPWISFSTCRTRRMSGLVNHSRT